MATTVETGSVVGEDFSLREADKDLTLLQLLQEANKCSDCNKQLSLLTKCISHTASCERSSIEYLMLLEEFQTALMATLDSAIIPAFNNKEYFSYEKEEFKKYLEITYCVLLIVDNILHRLEHGSKKEIDRLIEIDDFVPHVRNLALFLPKLLLIIGAHMNCPLWSSTKLEDMSLRVLDRLLVHFSCKSPEELFSIHTYDEVSLGKVMGNKVTLFGTNLLYCLKPLSKDLWHKNPFLCETFHWSILQMKLPNLSNYIEQIMSVSLNFLEDHQPVSKIRGISCLHHLIMNTSAEEMRWLNRADVIYEKLKTQVYLKDVTVIECLYPCLFDILKVLESPPDLDRHHYVLDTLLRDTEGENLLALRKIYVHSLSVLVEQIGIYSVCHLQTLIKIIGYYLEIDDGFSGVSARADTLKLLEVIIRVAWPRISHHADAILKLCLNFIADINCTIYQDTDNSDAQAHLTAEAIQCLVLLSEVCSDVLPCVKTALKSGMNSVEKDSHLYEILGKQLAKLDT